MSEDIQEVAQELIPEQQAYIDAKFAYANLLRESSTPVSIVFTKLDGTVREMQATLNPSIVELPAVTGNSTIPLSNLVVYDVEQNGWRTIILNRVVSFVADGEEKVVTGLVQLGENLLPVGETDE